MDLIDRSRRCCAGGTKAASSRDLVRLFLKLWMLGNGDQCFSNQHFESTAADQKSGSAALSWNPRPAVPLPKVLRLLFFIVLLLAPDLSDGASAKLTPPCEGPPVPAYTPAGQPPATDVWSRGELTRSGWQAATCLNWGTSSTKLAAALAGEFRFAGPLDDLADRLVRFSALKSVRYWSVSRQAWQPLVSDSGTLDGPDGKGRADPAAAELTPGRSFYYFEVSHGRAVYRMTVRERTAERLVVSTENVTPIHVGILTAFEPGALQSVIFLDKRGPGLWGYYQTIRATEGASAIALGSDASYVNRLAALYRHMAGIPTDQEPPAAR